MKARSFTAVRNLEPGAGRSTVCFEIRPARGEFPHNWVGIALRLNEPDVSLYSPVLRIQIRIGEALRSFNANLKGGRGGKLEAVVRIIGQIHSMTLELEGAPETIQVWQARVRPLNKYWAAARVALLRAPKLYSRRDKAVEIAAGALGALRRGGARSAFRYLGRRLSDLSCSMDDYSRWVELYDRITDADRAAIRRRIQELPDRPMISVLMAVHDTEERWLRKAVESVISQLYPHWELCIADDGSTLPHVRRVLEEYRLRDERIRVVYREENGHICAASSSALEAASGRFVALMDHDDELSEHALYLVAEAILSHPEPDLIYSDEDKIDVHGLRFYPHFKPDWNPDLFYAYNMVSHLAAYRTSLVREVGGFRKGFEGSQDYDLTLRVIERTAPERIRHIPHVLYHWRAIRGSVAFSPDQKSYAEQAASRAIRSHFDRVGVRATVRPGLSPFHRVEYPLPVPLPKVSLIVCTRDRLSLLKGIVEGVLYQTDYASLELILVDNQSIEPATLAYLEGLRREPRARVVRHEAPFNFSELNNLGVAASSGELLAFLNNDLKVIAPGWLKEMVSHALRAEVGAVGAKLYYPDDTIQHAGVIVGLGGVAGHSHKYLPRHETGFVGRLAVTQDLTAVTAACLVMRRQVFQEVGRFDATHLPIAFNDVDLCLRIRRAGYRIVWTPYAELYHLESASRGSDMTAANIGRFKKEMELMKQRWGEALRVDPNYSPNLTIDAEDFSYAFPPRAGKPWLSR